MTLLYFLMQNNTAVLSISTTVANLALSKSQFLRIIQMLVLALLTYAFVYIFIVILFCPAAVSDPF